MQFALLDEEWIMNITKFLVSVLSLLGHSLCPLGNEGLIINRQDLSQTR